MNKLNISSPSNGIPFNWDDLEWILGQAAYDAGIYNALNMFFGLFGTDFIITGCAEAGGNVSEGWVFLNGELLKVDAHAATEPYFEKVTTYNSDGNKQTELSGTTDIYEKNRATVTSSSGALEITFGDTFADKLREFIPASTTGKGTVELGTNVETLTGTDTSRVPPISAVANRMGNLITKVIEIGDWNMDSTDSISVNHGITNGNQYIRSVKAIIRNDADTTLLNLEFSAAGTGIAQGSIGLISSTQILLSRLSGGATFDSVNYDSTSFNRGWVVIEYAQ